MIKLRHSIILLLLLSVASLLPSVHAKTTTDRITSILFNDHKVINMLDDFLLFWDQAKDKTPKEQRLLWKKMVEWKYQDYFDRAVYRTTDKATRRMMLDEFLSNVPGKIEAIRKFNATLIPYDNPLITAILAMRVHFPDYKQQQDIYIGLSLFTFDGSVRPLFNEDGLPDTLCLGAEVIVDYMPEQLQVMLAHEFFHLYHFSFLFKERDLTQYTTAHIPLMIEGMAVAGSEEMYPGWPRKMYFHIADEELVVQRKELSMSSGMYLEMIRRGAEPAEYEKWFNRTPDAGIPPRGGYLLGYEVTKRLLATMTLEQLVRLSPADLREQAEEQLSAMSTERPIMMALN